MLSEKDILSMLYLLDDSDERVVLEISERIKALGGAVIPLLEQAWNVESNPQRVERILELIKEINAAQRCQELRTWKKEGSDDLLAGILIIDRIHRPNLDRQDVENKLDKIKLDAWLELKYDLTSFEKVKILNYVFFDQHGFQGDTENYHLSKNSFINEVLESRKGNPISLAVIYALVAQRLNIPVYGVNLPQHFILGYVSDLDWEPLRRYNDGGSTGDMAGSEVAFYINPFNNGLIFPKENIHQFLAQLKIEAQDSFFTVCSHTDILKRILRNLSTSYEKEGNEGKLSLVQEMMAVLLED